VRISSPESAWIGAALPDVESRICGRLRSPCRPVVLDSDDYRKWPLNLQDYLRKPQNSTWRPMGST
jgi:hypothetical protein